MTINDLLSQHTAEELVLNAYSKGGCLDLGFCLLLAKHLDYALARLSLYRAEVLLSGRSIYYVDSIPDHVIEETYKELGSLANYTRTANNDNA